LPKVVQSGSIANPSGNRVPVSLLSRVPAAKIANLLMGGIGGALVLEAGVALYDLAKEQGFSLTKTPSGVTATKPAPIGPNAWSPFPTFSTDGLLNLTTCPAQNGTWRTAGYCLRADKLGIYAWVDTTTKTSLESSGWTYYENGGSMHGLVKNLPAGTVVTASPDQPALLQELADSIAVKSGWPSGSKVSQALVDAAAITGTKIQPDAGTVTGPATSPGKVTTTVNTTNNTTKTETVTHNHTYEGANVNTYNTITTVVINNADGSVVSSETTTDTPPAKEDVPFCGLPGYPDCNVKVNETGTPTATDTKYDAKADAVKVQKDLALDTMKGTSDKSGFFSGWSVFWSAPAFVACTPYQLPEFKGASMGSIDPCPVVDGVRTIMAYIWALAGLFLCLGFVRESIQKG
jgi:hypothetical protein